MSRAPKLTSLQKLFNISRKTWRMKLVFCLQVSSNWYYHFGLCVVKPAQITQNKKFAVLSHYLKKEVSDEVDILHADKHKSFLQIDTMIFDGRRSSIPKVPKITSLQCLYNISERKLEMKLSFCMQINIEVSCKLISTLSTSKFPTRGYCHYWWAWSSIIKVLRVTS